MNTQQTRADSIAAVAREWRALIEPFAPIGERMAALMPEPGDPQLRHELYRLQFMAMSLGYMGLGHANPDYPDFISIINPAHNLWAPNPDNVYYMSPIDPAGVYRISGFRGTVRIVDVSVMGGLLVPRGTGAVGKTYADYDVDQLRLGDDGSFEVVFSAERPSGYEGDWWRVDPQATHLIVRQVAYDWLTEVDGRFAIERLDVPALRPRLTAPEIAEALREVAAWTENWTRLGLQMPRNYLERELTNRLVVRDLSDEGGLTTQRYLEGIFDTAVDEALVYETEVPRQCRYWNVQLSDMMWGGLDYMGRQTSINGHTARLDTDGRFRAVISAADPGVPNWLDTNGHTQGVIFGRWRECDSWPTPSLLKIKLAELRKHLPADTPVISTEARAAAIRLRRKGAQLRRRW